MLSLSGGNQQKVLLAKALVVEPEIILLDEPTRGVDVGAKAEIYRIIDDLAAAGKAVLVVSSEMNEILSMSDRILVMHQGRLTGSFDGPNFSPDLIGAAAAGVVAEGNGGSDPSSKADSLNAPWLDRVLKRPEAAPIAFLAIISILLSLTTTGFWSSANFLDIISQVAVVGDRVAGPQPGHPVG